MIRPPFPERGAALGRRLMNIGFGPSPEKRRKTGIALLGRLGERAATAEVLSLLERRLRAARGAEELLIAQVLGKISPAGGERLRDVVLEIALEGDAGRILAAATQHGAEGFDLVACVPRAAWRRLDPEVASGWIGRAAVLLAKATPTTKKSTPPMASNALPAQPGILDSESDEAAESMWAEGKRFRMILDILWHCVDQAPAHIQELAPVFSADCHAEISLQVFRLLRRFPVSGTTIAAPGSLTAQSFEATAISPPLQRTGGATREMIVSRLLELTASESRTVRRQAIAELSGTPCLAGNPRIGTQLVALAGSEDMDTRIAAAVALAKMKGSDPSPELIRELLHIVAEEESWPAGTLTLLQKTYDPEIFDALANRLIDLLQTTSGPTGVPPTLPTMIRNPLRKPPGWTLDALKLAWQRPQRLVLTDDARHNFALLDVKTVTRDRRVRTLLEYLEANALGLEVERLQMLLQHSLPAVRWAALNIVAERVRKPGAERSLVDTVSRLLSDEDAAVKAQASQILERPNSTGAPAKGGYSTYPSFLGGRIGEADSMANLVALRLSALSADLQEIMVRLQSPGQWGFALRALTVLSEDGVSLPPTLLPPLCAIAFGPDALEPYQLHHLDKPVESLIGSIVRAWPGEPESSQAIEAALAALRSPRQTIRERAASVFGYLGPDSAGISIQSVIESILDILSSAEPGQRAAALLTLKQFGRRGWDAAGERMVALLADADSGVRRAAVELTQAHNNLPLEGPACDSESYPAIVSALCAFIDDPKFSFERRFESAKLNRTAVDSAVQAAIEAIASFGAAAYPSAAFTLLNLIFDDASQTQFLAARTLCDMGPEAQRRVLECLLVMIE